MVVNPGKAQVFKGEMLESFQSLINSSASRLDGAKNPADFCFSHGLITGGLGSLLLA